MACSSNFQEYAINGVKVKFPYKPYPSQFSMMDKIIKCIERKQNSLLESPTGSGKSLALLCSSLAWLMVEKEKVLRRQIELERSLRQYDESTEDVKPSFCGEFTCVKEEKPDVSSIDIKPCIKLEPNASTDEIKVKIEKPDSSSADIKPTLPFVSNSTLGTNASVPRDVKIKVEKPDVSGGEINQALPCVNTNSSLDIKIKMEKPDESYDEKPFKTEDNNDHVLGDIKVPATVAESNGEAEMAKKDSNETGEKEDVCGMEEYEFNDEADFQAPKKRFRTPWGQSMPKSKRRRQTLFDENSDAAGSSTGQPEWSMELDRPGENSTTNNTSNFTTCSDSNKDQESCNVERKKALQNQRNFLDEDMMLVLKAPKIYFGTRTHKQITQIVRELNKTEYRTTKMCILASREHTCIHPEVSKCKNKNEECRKSVENREGKSCLFHARSRHVKNQQDLEDYGITKAWDIAELVQLGEKIKGCPYYMTREIMKDADIIFCPYNYLIDPIIRKQMDIHLEDQIVILDEAHNIEDSSREAASWSVSTHSLDEAMTDLDYLISRNMYREQHEVLHVMCANLRKWIVEKAEHLTGLNDSKTSNIWEGQELRQALDELNFISNTVRILSRHFMKAMSPPASSHMRQRERTSMHAATASLFEGLFVVLTFLLKDDYKFLCDYRAAIIKEYSDVPAILPGGFRRKGEFERKLVCTLHFWCLSPAVAFLEICQPSRSVILTSGTLSPMSTFSSELGCQFPIQLEANHVVNSSQVWVSSLSAGPSGSAINATYRYSETSNFQDEVGEAIYKVCEVVPYGVLCFLPSYSMLDKLMNRWKMTGLWGRLCRLKNTFSEPRRGDKADFNGIMSDFYEAIRFSEDSDCEHGVSGALFLAVCRGKVSEGLDFADNNARAVITVGIPFPNVKDIQVELKRKYNDKYCSTKGLLNGNEWYEIQAYRALNQALGRCIRHRNDWGAILLIDERFGRSPKYRSGLSKWLRNKVVHHNNFQNLLSSLKKFAQARLEDPCPNTTMLQTPSGTPKRSPNSNETKSPLSLSSSSQSSPTPTTASGSDTPCIKTEPRLITPVPKCPQTTPQLPNQSPESIVSSLRKFQYTPQKPTNQNSATAHEDSKHSNLHVPKAPSQIPGENHMIVNTTPGTPQLFISANQISSSTPIVGRGMAPKMLYLTPLNHPRLIGTADNPQRMINPQQVRVVLNPQQINSPQQTQPTGLNRPVFVRLVSPSGQPVHQPVIPGQRVQLVEPRTAMRSQGHNGIFFKIGMGQPGTQLAQNYRVVQLGGVGHGIRLDMTGHAGPEGTSVANAEAPGGLQTQMSTPGFVRVKEEDSLGNQRDINGKQSNIRKRSLFSNSKPNQADNEEMSSKVDDEHDSALKCQKNVPKLLDIRGCRVTEPEDRSPDSPLLFVTPPSSFGNSDDEHEDIEGNEGVVSVKSVPMDTTGDGNILESMDTARDGGIVETGGEGVVRVESEPMNTSGDGKILEPMETTFDGKVPDKKSGTGVVRARLEPMNTTVDGENHGKRKGDKANARKSKNTAGSKEINREKKSNDILDIFDETSGTNSNNITCSVKCKACGSIFYSSDNCNSNGGKPCEEDIPCSTFLGNVLNSLLSLNTNRKKTASTLTTLRVACGSELQGCSPYEGQRNKQDMKLNSIYCEGNCYVSLVCQQCKESRVNRGRTCIIAVRAMSCMAGNNNNQSMVWFNRDKVELV